MDTGWDRHLKTARPYRVLGVYTPDRWRASWIGPRLCELTHLHGLAPHISTPMLKLMEKSSWKDYDLHANVVRFANPQYEGSSWHQDGDHAPSADMNCALVLWCSHTPVLIRDKAGIVWQPQPLELVLFNNLDVHHRRPDVTGKRWVFRQRVRRVDT